MPALIFALLLVDVSAQADPFFVDATREAGLERATVSGGPHKRFILESTGSGAAFFDYDGDGDLDLYAVDGSTYANYGVGPGNVLYRNDGGAFVPVAAGVEDRGWGMGVAVGDYDGDGQSDLYVTNYEGNALYRNRGDGAFASVSAQAGVAGDDFSASAAFFDYDQDGDLDLYVANYVVFDIEPVLQDPDLDDPCIYLGGLRVFCGPQGMEGGQDRLYRNDGGTFADVTAASGVAAANFHYGLGVMPADFDRDGDLDLFVANDETPNVLFRNEGGRLSDIGLQAGVAYNGDGELEASMGVDAGDCDGDGDLFTTNIDDSPTLLRNETRTGRYLVVQIDPEVFGTRVRLTVGGRTQVRSVGGSAGYLGHSDAHLYFGLGRVERVERLEVRCPDGAVTRLEDLPVDEVVVVKGGDD